MLDLEKTEKSETKLPTSVGSEKAREFQKNISFCFINYPKDFVWVTTNCRKFSEMGGHLTCLLRNLYADQEATVRLLYGKTDSKLGKEFFEAVYCHPVYLTYIQSHHQNARLYKAQAGIKIAGRNINNLKYADNTTLMADRERN